MPNNTTKKTKKTTNTNSKNKRLGKGLDAIFGGDITTLIDDIENNTPASKQVLVSLDEIRPNPYQPRKLFDEEKLQELAVSIKEHGVFQPVILKSSIQGYEIVAGERRFRASKLAGLTEIPALVKQITPESAMEIALIENVQRENLNPIEESNAYKNIMDKCGYELSDVARLIGKSESYIKNTMRLDALPADVKSMVEKGDLSASQARLLVVAENPTELAKQIVNNKMSVVEAEKLVKGAARKTTSRAYVAKTMDPKVVRDIEFKISDALGVKVKLQERRGGAGQIILSFATRVQMQELIDKLTK